MLSGMTSGEVTEWQAYEAIEPWGEERADLRTGILASLIANIVRQPGQKAHEPKEFMPQFGPREAEKNEEPSLLQKALSVFSAFKQTAKPN